MLSFHINYYYTTYINYHKCINLIGQWVKSEHVITQDKNHIPWNKNHILPPQKPRGFSRQSYRSLTGKRQRHSERITLLWMWFLNVWDNVPVDLKYVCQQYFTCMCFLGFIRYNKTFIVCGFREYDTLGWINFHIFLTNMQ
jgi:hypothetical protein